MAETTDIRSQIPTESSIEKLSYQAMSANWFEYPIVVHPHHTDYGGIVWHGTYLTWMEEARVECLKSIGIDFADLVSMGCDLPVVDLSLRYHRSLKMGESAIVKTRTIDMEGVRIIWEYEIQSADREITYLTGMVTLVAVDREKGKIMRQLPNTVKDALVKMRE
ncbi:acyl-CoA thioesterase [Chamaesiphon minutus]|jgi:acyl-CoA thioester hydrolase|uniref:Acyl-CoA thioester hydrolase, YbgC/YbaW family n=1 Tax=Chamaesiphon minutus (strain ATCC 27169 / PCC 6605) TaxID=1173020 RepID=K9UJY0_CHAP6|nr:thioesterase family protein [Chamaesiphon minutus]AFY95392.1 acyl-CoA thioester hydrolase, YbgC/YbaW family [Chamaesiphon minutus PCC 6605]